MARVLPAVSLVLTLVFLEGRADAQFTDRAANPSIPVTLTHAPSLGIQARRIAFGAASGPCSEQLIDMLTEDFVNSNIEVLDRQHLNALLAEHDLSVSGYVDQTRAVELGRVLGPTALVFAKVQRCASDKKALHEERKQSDKKLPPTTKVNISRTQFFFKGSIQTVDLATGRIFSATTVENSPSRQNESSEGIPEFPSAFELQDASLHEAATAIHRLFFPWTEQRRLIFFDDKECGLKQAAQMVKAGDAEEALRRSEANLSACRSQKKVESKTLAHAYYNLGMSHYMVGEYDEALDHLTEARKLRPGDVVNSAIALASEAGENAAQMQRLDERMAVETEEDGHRTRQREAVATSRQLTTQDVVAMRQAGLSDDLIAAAIRKNNRAFDLSVADMLRLKKDGVSDDLMKLMLDPSAPVTAARK